MTAFRGFEIPSEDEMDQPTRELVSLDQALTAARNPYDSDAMIAALRSAVAHPCAHHAYDLADLYSDLSEELLRKGDHDAALQAMETAIDAGYGGCQPHQNARLAEIHLAAGRADEAARQFAEVKALCPHDVWLHNVAGMSYADTGDHRTAATWFADGLDVAYATGDPAGLVDQLNDLRTHSLKALGHGSDEITARAVRFLRGEERPPVTKRQWKPQRGERPQRPCDHCGFDPDALTQSDLDTYGDEFDVWSPQQQPTQMSIAWFPASEWEEAVGRWPDLDEPGGHRAHSRAKESTARELARHATGAVDLAISPIEIDPYVTWCEHESLDAGASSSRARYAAEVSRRGRAIAWPPARNERCWCGSGAKYKKCCGAQGDR